jgi:DNA-binding response OmpR family regulator
MHGSLAMDHERKNMIPWVSELAPDSFKESGRNDKSKILVIDDEPVNTQLFEAILGDNGYMHVRSINDSRIAMQTCESFRPDLILLDLMMPYFDGLAILRALRSEPNQVHVPVIVLTADETDETKLRALDAGATDFMLKPFDLTEVLLRIKNRLEQTKQTVEHVAGR